MTGNELQSLSQKSSPSNKVKCIQINLRHSKSASLALAQVILDFEIDVVLIQEPFAFSGPTPVVAHIPPGYSSFP